MAYYYLDENNHMKVTEIYGVNHADNDRVPTLSRNCSRRQSIKESAKSKSSKDDSGVSGVSAPELEAAILAKVPGASSGYRRQSQAQPQSSKEKDREGTPPAGSGSGGLSSAGGSGVQRSASFPKHRRSPLLQQSALSGSSGSGRTGFSGGSLSGRSKTIAFVSPISTASESEEAEKLFVPERRRRIDSETEAAAYEPEDSSGED